MVRSKSTLIYGEHPSEKDNALEEQIKCKSYIVVYHSAISKCCKELRNGCGYYKDTKEKANLHFIYSPTTTERVDVNQLTD